MPDFSEELPEWTAEGIEPPESKKSTGWQVDDHPPAGWLNWLFNRIYTTIVEIRSVFSAHKADTTAHVTVAERSTWNAKETTAGAQAKADAAQSAAISAAAADATTKANAAAVASIPLTQKGAASGVASLDASTKLPAGQLPISAVQATTADVTYYVRTEGNDSNNGLANTAAGAFKTIAKALAMIPQTISHNVTVNVAAGTYAEDVNVYGFRCSSAGQLTIQGDTVISTSRNVLSITFRNCHGRVEVAGFTATTTTGTPFASYYSSGGIMTNVQSTAANSNVAGIDVAVGDLRVLGAVISNKAYYATVNSTARLFIRNASGSGNNYGIYSYIGGDVSKGTGITYTSTNGDAVGEGGLITPVGGVLNPWGDNTTSSRPFVSASHTAQQTISSANSWLRVICGAESNDNLGNYDPSTGLFNCPTAGMYLVIAAVEVTNAVAGDELKLAIGSDAAVLLNADHQRPGSSGYQQLTGSAIIVVAANAKLAMWVTSSRSGTTTNPDGYYTYMQVIKIA
ncbi:hypothetical protein PSTEL_09735 [Paenibacillus stellifer]|uniref:C1q domain-containing protein n=1 Tax=Paenibacillus stellifer TaxID=169760 RepID=A0A089N3P3_9BACL|nr:hypothetical protein [Paenibacillus stellifer]AIQ63324.1 hypothetical protein PSTEL_09735 [Paenibacillus stellifer]